MIVMFIIYGGVESYDEYTCYDIEKKGFHTFEEALDRLKARYQECINDLKEECEDDEVEFDNRYEDNLEITFIGNEFAFFSIKDKDGCFRIYYEIRKIEY